MKTNDIKNINTLKMLGINAIDSANSGHPGIVLGAATSIYTLFTKHLNINPKDANWKNRDRFVMSAGHGSALLYSMMHLSGFQITKKDLKDFRKLNSKTPGHPEYKHTAGIDATTGPLGQGIAMAVGMAMAEDHLKNVVGKKFIDHKTYVLCGDGDLQEGISFEALSLAGRHKLNNLIVMMDSNDIQLDSKVSDTTLIDIKSYIESIGFNYIKVNNGENINEIDKALIEAKKSDLPTFIEIKTIIGRGSLNEGTTSVHGAPLSKDDIINLKESLNIDFDNFDYDNNVLLEITNSITSRVESTYKKSIENEKDFESKYPDYFNQFSLKRRSKSKFNFKNLNLKLNQATRASSGELFNKLQEQNKSFFGGSVDLTASTKVKGIRGDYDLETKSNNNIKFGVREFASAAIVNGITLHGGLISFTSTFFTFADYLKPALRLSALMELPSLYIFTHDSVFVGEDGPTHEPVEQLSLIRSIPNVADFRPADTNELIGSWKVAMSLDNTPSVIINTRQNLNELENSKSALVKKGAYIIYGEKDSDITIFATGSEVNLAIEVAKNLKSAKVISIPSVYLFNKQGYKYYNDLVGNSKLKVIIEASEGMSLKQYISPSDLSITMNSFGLSGEGSKVYKKLGFDVDSIVKKIEKHNT